jgi:hypothetical protein
MCAIAQADLDLRCKVYSSPDHAPDRRVTTFRLDGVDVGLLAPAVTTQTAQPTTWHPAAGISITLRSILESPPTQLEFVLQIANSTAQPFTVRGTSFPFSYVMSGTRVPRPSSGAGFPTTVAPSATALAYVAFSASSFGGVLTVREGQTASTQIVARKIPRFRLPVGPPA